MSALLVSPDPRTGRPRARPVSERNPGRVLLSNEGIRSPGTLPMTFLRTRTALLVLSLCAAGLVHAQAQPQPSPRPTPQQAAPRPAQPSQRPAQSPSVAPTGTTAGLPAGV